MKTIDSLSLSAIVRFALTGFIGIILYVVIPITIFYPTKLTIVTDLGGAVSILVLAFTAGFVIDGLKLYQLAIGYKRRRTEFYKQIATALDVDVQDASAFFVKAAQLERELGMGQIDFVHSRWVMLDVCGKLIFLASVIWGGVGVAEALNGASNEAFALITIAAICCVIAIRLFFTARQEQKRVEYLYIHFCKRHKEMILGSDIMQKERIKEL